VEELGIPRSTLQHWIERKNAIDADPLIIEFFESPSGTAFMHRLALGAHFVMTMMGSCSVRQVCQFFELTGLDRFIASSYGAQHKVSVEIEQAIVEFGQEEKCRLADGMPHKEITVCEDETFHPETCLVAIEPVSNFIILEKYADSRKASEWTQCLEEASKDLPVEIVQSTSDEGTGILHHVKKDIGAHHSPDVFHVQHEVVKGTSAPLSRKTKKAEIDLEKATEQLNQRIKEKEVYENGKNGRGRPPQFDKRIEQARSQVEEATQLHERAQSHQTQMKAAIRKISDTYHPVDIETGKLKDVEAVSESLTECFSQIEAVASEANLSEPCLKRIKKAKKVVVDMVATILFFYFSLRAKVEALNLEPQVETAVVEKLIPAIYLQQASEKAKSAEIRHRLRKQSEDILSALRDKSSPFAGLEQEELITIEKVSQECASLFQRSSSCVEGRNGQLSLRHHSLHRLSNRKLAALTTVHNYFIKRSDGTTSAERFFGSKPREMFEFLLGKIDLPGRPAAKRFQPQQKSLLQAAA
jgi:hypothetical protein